MYGKFGVILTSLAIMAGAAFGQPAPGPMHRPGGGMARGLAQLNLTDEQKTQLQGLRADYEKALVQLHAKIATARIDLRSLVQADKLDRAAIEKTVGTISDLQHQEKLALIDHLFKANALLSPEQQKKFKGMLGGMLSGNGMRGRMWLRGMQRMGNRPMQGKEESEPGEGPQR